MRIFIDTNVLISATVFRGNEFALIQKAFRKRHEILISEHIVDEAMRVMLMKFPEHLPEFIEFMQTAEIGTFPKEKYERQMSKYSNIRDVYDRHVLAAAIESKSDVIITGDRDLLAYETEKIKIATARAFLMSL